MISHFMTRCIS